MDSMIKGVEPWAFDALAGSSIFWVAQAEQLDRAAGLAFHQWDADTIALQEGARRQPPFLVPVGPSTATVALFLCALATENLLKGRLVVARPDAVTGGAFKKKTESNLRSHCLKDVAEEAGILFSPAEETFCLIAEECIASFGRYPSSLNHVHQVRELRFGAETFAIYVLLYERLNALLRKEPFLGATVDPTVAAGRLSAVRPVASLA